MICLTWTNTICDPGHIVILLGWLVGGLGLGLGLGGSLGGLVALLDGLDLGLGDFSHRHHRVVGVLDPREALLALPPARRVGQHLVLPLVIRHMAALLHTAKKKENKI